MSQKLKWLTISPGRWWMIHIISIPIAAIIGYFIIFYLKNM